MTFPILLDPRAPEPLQYQLCRELRAAILGGRLARGQRLPSSRSVAETLAISRTTVVLSYEQLVSEGYLEAAHGSGTFVCRQLPEEFLAAARRAGTGPVRQAPPPARWSRLGTRLLDLEIPPPDPASGARWRFNQIYPSQDSFPVETWRRLLARHCQRSGPALGDDAPESTGCEVLRRAIAGYLRASRGLDCQADQVLVLGSSQQGLDLVAQAWLDPGDLVAMEDPGYPGARRTFHAHGARILPLPAAAQGVSLAPLAGNPACRLVYVTPSHQFPTGTTMGLAQRLELLEGCRRSGAVLLEDDYDSEFRYGGRPLPATQGLDAQGRVLYVGTFSKVLFPALRMGYLVAPPGWLPVLTRAYAMGHGQPPLLEQYALADFIREGHLERHLRRLRTLYGRRREALLSALDAELGDRVEILGEPCGMHIMVRFRTRLEDADVLRRARAEGVALAPGSRYCLEPGPRAGFLMGFAAMDEGRIRPGVRRLARILQAPKADL